MSYARWSDSDWYAFTDASGDADDPRMAMWHCRVRPLYYATFSQLDGIDEDALAALVPEAPRDDVPELLEYVREFCDDVREQRATTTRPTGAGEE